MSLCSITPQPDYSAGYAESNLIRNMVVFVTVEEEYSEKKSMRNHDETTSQKRRVLDDNHRVPNFDKGSVLQESQPYAVSSDPLIINHRRATPDAKTTLRHKYGFLIPEPYVLDPRMAKVILPTEDGELIQGHCKSEKKAMRRLGMDTATSSAETTCCVLDLYNYVAATEEPRVFAPLWNFTPRLHRDIVEHEYFHSRRIRRDSHIIGVRDMPLEKQGYLLVLYNARAVAELFHQQISSVKQMVQYLIEHGIRFSTAKPVRSPPHTPASFSTPTLSYRQNGHKFDLSDYADYEKKKGKFLLGSGSAGRAALCRGGIVWRLAVDIVRPDQVTAGPTPSAALYDTKFADLGDLTLVDDTLSSDNEDIICGVYKIHTEIQSQTQNMSWFPKASIWDASGHSHGYWTADNEEWYQKRLSSIQRGGGPKDVKQWRRILKDIIKPAPVKKFERWISSVSDQFLQGNTSYWKE